MVISKDQSTFFISFSIQLISKSNKSKIADVKDSQSDLKDKTISYNYKLQNGISKQFIALDILKSKFTDDLDIIEKAMSVKKRLLV